MSRLKYHSIWAAMTMTLLVTVLFAAVNPLPAGVRDHTRPAPLKEGVFLVATPLLGDPHFIHTVILLVSYGKEGALGLVINRSAGVHLGQIFPDIEWIKKGDFSLYSGGPVNRNNLFILFSSDNPPLEAQKVFGDVYFSSRKDVILSVLHEGDPDRKIRVYAGCAGWAPGQLEQEMARGSWIAVEADPEMIFTDDPYKIWPSIFRMPEDLLVRL